MAHSPDSDELTPAFDGAAIRSERKALRQALLDRLADEGETDLFRRLDKCGNEVVLVCTCCGVTKTVESRCDLKWCPSCQHALAAATAARYEQIMALCRWPLRTTLTARNFAYDELHGLRDLRRAWSRLRRLRWFRARVPGGVTAFEITEKGKGWHVHCHGLWDCEWLAVDECRPRIGATKAEWARKGKAACSEVAEQWSLCCGRPASVNVRRVWKRDGGDIGPAIRETLKYSVKGSDLANSSRAVGPLIHMLDGTRMVTSFGTFFGRPECKRIKPGTGKCDGCGAVGAIMPESVVLRTARDEHGLTDSTRRRR